MYEALGSTKILHLISVFPATVAACVTAWLDVARPIGFALDVSAEMGKIWK